MPVAKRTVKKATKSKPALELHPKDEEVILDSVSKHLCVKTPSEKRDARLRWLPWGIAIIVVGMIWATMYATHNSDNLMAMHQANTQTLLIAIYQELAKVETQCGINHP